MKAFLQNKFDRNFITTHKPAYLSSSIRSKNVCPSLCDTSKKCSWSYFWQVIWYSLFDILFHCKGTNGKRDYDNSLKLWWFLPSRWPMGQDTDLRKIYFLCNSLIKISLKSQLFKCPFNTDWKLTWWDLSMNFKLCMRIF